MGLFDFLKRQKKYTEGLTNNAQTPFEIKLVLPESPEIEVINRASYTPKSKGELSEVTQGIWTYAPDEYHDMYWPTPERPTLETDFEELRRGIEHVFRQKRFNESRPKLLELVEHAYSAYKSGDRKHGMKLISKIQIMYGQMK